MVLAPRLSSINFVVVSRLCSASCTISGVAVGVECITSLVDPCATRAVAGLGSLVERACNPSILSSTWVPVPLAFLTRTSGQPNEDLSQVTTWEGSDVPTTSTSTRSTGTLGSGNGHSNTTQRRVDT